MESEAMSDIIQNFKIKSGLTVRGKGNHDTGSLLHTTTLNNGGGQGLFGQLGIGTQHPGSGSRLEIRGALSASNLTGQKLWNDAAKNTALYLSGSIQLTSGSNIIMDPVEIGIGAVSRDGGTAIGHNAQATGITGISIGAGRGTIHNWGVRSIALGYGPRVYYPPGADAQAARASVSIGDETVTNSKYNIAIGYHATASAPNAIAIGMAANSGIGNSSVTDMHQAGASHSIAIGQYATVTGTGTSSIAIGPGNYTNYNTDNFVLLS